MAAIQIPPGRWTGQGLSGVPPVVSSIDPLDQLPGYARTGADPKVVRCPSFC